MGSSRHRRWLSLSLVLIALLVSALPQAVLHARDALPAYKILFTSDRDGGYGVYTADVTTGVVKQVTKDSLDEQGAVWSPDGKSILYTSRLDGRGQIYIADRDGGNSRHLITSQTIDTAPQWAPDGKRIAYIAEDATERVSLYVAGADGKAPRKLALKGAPLQTAWSPDGKMLAVAGVFQDPKGHSSAGIVTVPASGGSAKVIVTDTASAYWWPSDTVQWSSDGKQILYSRDSQVVAVSLDGTKKVLVEAGYAASWSPDGKKLLYYGWTDQKHGIYMAEADGSNPRLVVEGGANAPMLSPDGTTILFGSDRDKIIGLYEMNADGSQSKRLAVDLANVSSTAISANGKRVAFGVYDRAKQVNNVYLLDNTLSPVLVGQGRYPALSPDGSRLVYATNRDEQPVVVAVNTDQTGETVISKREVNGLTWSPDGETVLVTVYSGAESGFYLIDMARGSETKFAPMGSINVLGFTADSKSLIAMDQSTSEVYFASLDGKTKQPVKGLAFAQGCAWSPDGKQVAAIGWNRAGGSYFGIFTANANGSNLRQVSKYATDVPGELLTAWTPDGKHVLYSKPGGNTEIYTVDLDGSHLKNLSNSIGDDSLIGIFQPVS